MKQMLNTKLHRGDALVINAVNCKSSHDDIETMLENTSKENVLKGVKFVRNEHMAWLLKFTDPLERLKINARRIPHQLGIKQKQKHFGVGVRVRRGPDCKSSNQDGGRPGKVIGFNQSGWAIVKWDNGYMDSYRIGQEDSQDLEII
ncbi:E3 ubiquitin-protein ligase HECTD1-like isoform X1 [Ruditapes philippinarum]|uniref:E3 ubiquitin-protein ligase HECTD1-like isoform X1 n=1 Tax=Ruditapes philippinarum TaxID=129788 RepID=UPI00295AF75E|nr:E3 ubiquitin-protein ligase HECTD1-like isoform X1 [Ruditapes philippinarum]